VANKGYGVAISFATYAIHDYIKKILIFNVLIFSFLCIGKSMVIRCNAIGDNIYSLIYFCKLYSKNLPRELNPKIS
jgi:hypothetical protein